MIILVNARMANQIGWGEFVRREVDLKVKKKAIDVAASGLNRVRLGLFATPHILFPSLSQNDSSSTHLPTITYLHPASFGPGTS